MWEALLFVEMRRVWNHFNNLFFLNISIWHLSNLVFVVVHSVSFTFLILFILLVATWCYNLVTGTTHFGEYSLYGNTLCNVWVVSRSAFKMNHDSKKPNSTCVQILVTRSDYERRFRGRHKQKQTDVLPEKRRMYKIRDREVSQQKSSVCLN